MVDSCGTHLFALRANLDSEFAPWRLCSNPGHAAAVGSGLGAPYGDKDLTNPRALSASKSPCTTTGKEFFRSPRPVWTPQTP